MVEGIVLAAGSSSRAGTFKMELAMGEKPMLATAVDGMCLVCGRVIVVGGYLFDRVVQLMSPYPHVEVIENVQWRMGMFSSVKAGVRCLRGTTFFVLPADVPMVPESVYRRLLAEPGEVVVPVYQGRKGHPVLLRHQLKKNILQEPDDSSLRQVVRRAPVTEVEAGSEAILWDIDTPEDYREALHKLGLP